MQWSATREHPIAYFRVRLELLQCSQSSEFATVIGKWLPHRGIRFEHRTEENRVSTAHRRVLHLTNNCGQCPLDEGHSTVFGDGIRDITEFIVSFATENPCKLLLVFSKDIYGKVSRTLDGIVRCTVLVQAHQHHRRFHG